MKDCSDYKEEIIKQLQDENQRLRLELEALRHPESSECKTDFWHTDAMAWVRKGYISLLLDFDTAGAIRITTRNLPAMGCLDSAGRKAFFRSYRKAVDQKQISFDFQLSGDTFQTTQAKAWIIGNHSTEPDLWICTLSFLHKLQSLLLPEWVRFLNPLLIKGGHGVWITSSDGLLLSSEGAWDASEDMKGKLKPGVCLHNLPEDFKPFTDFIQAAWNSMEQTTVVDAFQTQYAAMFLSAGAGLNHGQRTGMSVFTDLSESLRTRTLTQEAEKLYQTLFDLSPAGMILEDVNGNILQLNQAILKSTGFTPEDLIGKNVSIFASEENLPFVRENINRILAGETLNIEAESYRKDGSLFYSQLTETLICLPSGEKAILSISQDITDRVMMERALTDEKEKYRRFFENVQDVFFRTDYDGTLRVISPSVERYLGYGYDELIGRKCQDYFCNSDDRLMMLRHMHQKGELIDFELPVTTRGGETRYVSMNAHFLYDNSGRIDAIEGTFRDITEKRQYLEDLKEARKKAEESVRLKTSLLANLSHEFRTPLNAILGFSQILHKSHPDPAVEEMAAKIHYSGDRLLKTLESIMLMAQLDAGIEPAEELWNLMEAASGILLEFEQKAKERSLFFLCEEDEDLYVKTDEKLLGIALKELLDNALKFTREGGISVRFRSLSSAKGPIARIEVRDTGCGIAPEKHDIIFKEFRQASEGISRNYEGMGLGLTIVDRITGLLGGYLSFESIPGNGTVFYLDIHRETTPGHPSESAITPSLPPRSIVGTPEVLLIEDNEANSEIVESFLHGICHVDVVPRFFDALQLLKRKNYDLFLIDINLGPGPDGTDLLKEIRLMDTYSDTPVIAVTGYALHSDRRKLMSAGFTHYISKPFQKNDLADLVKSSLGIQD